MQVSEFDPRSAYTWCPTIFDISRTQTISNYWDSVVMPIKSPNVHAYLHASARKLVKTTKHQERVTDTQLFYGNSESKRAVIL